MAIRSATDTANAATKSAQEQIDTLREQVERLLNETISPALIHAAERADHAVANAREIKDHQVDTVTTQVRAQPILAIAISALVGFLAGRFSK